MDIILPVGDFPSPGGVADSPAYEMQAGGRGANQALAAARTGAKVALVGRVGDDGMGLRILNGVRRDGVMTSGVAQSEKPTGLSVILINNAGESEVVVAAGANSDITNDQVPDEILKPKNILLLQMEIPATENRALLERAAAGGATTILNLAPARNIPQEMLEKLDYLIVNLTEARQIAEKLGLDVERDAAKLALALSQKGKLTCIVTLGPQGAVAVTPARDFLRIPALVIEHTVDRTGVGDAFCGTFAGMLHEGRTLEDALRYASVAGGLACTKRGAQDSFAFMGDIDGALSDFGSITREKI